MSEGRTLLQALGEISYDIGKNEERLRRIESRFFCSQQRECAKCKTGTMWLDAKHGVYQCGSCDFNERLDDIDDIEIVEIAKINERLEALEKVQQAMNLESSFHCSRYDPEITVCATCTYQEECRRMLAGK